MIDIVFPNNNEAEFLDTAKKLGVNELIFAYDDLSKIKKSYETKIALLGESKKNKSKEIDFLIIKSSGDDRRVIEYEKPDFMFGFEETAKRDFLHQRASGLNQILCKIAAKNKITILFPFSIIASVKGANQARIIGRMMQNAMLCKKYNTNHAFVSFASSPQELRAQSELKSFFGLLGIKSQLSVHS